MGVGVEDPGLRKPSHADLVRHYLAVCRSPVALTLAEWQALPGPHKAALEEANQLTRHLAVLEVRTITPDGVLMHLGEYDGGESYRAMLRGRNQAAFQALEDAGVKLGPTEGNA